uniref:Uncharacterized protein n=1 Tax=Anopheles culicifacies TaxID=139723 RepID=A0A182MF91_9DIPT
MWKLSVALLLVAVNLALANLAAESTVTSAKLINSPPPPPPPATSLGSLYRSARDDYNARRHCANCGPGYERDMRTYGGRQTGITGYYSGMGAIDDDRNWYYRPESFDDRYRGGVMPPSYSGTYRQPPYMGYDYDRYMPRPDDRGYGYGYTGMAMRTNYYDGGASRMPYYTDMMRGYGYRGNGYDNLDPQYAYYMTQRGNPNGMTNRDRFYGSPQGYYDDRMSYGGQYDHKNFRPWDQTYSRPLSSSSSSQSSPSSSLSAHASYHVQSHPAPEAGYGGQPGGHDQHSSGHASAAASYRPGQHHQSHQQPQHNGSDRPDYSPSDSSTSCCRNRYPDSAPNAGSYSSHNTQHNSRPSALSYGGGESAHRPSGSWNYVSSGTTTGTGDSNHGTNTGHVGVSINTHGSYGEPHVGPGQYPGGGSGGNAHEYGANRGSDHRRESDNRQQSFAYGGRPRPASVGDTSYMMDRDDNHIKRVSTDQDSARPTNDDSDKRAKSDIESFTSDQSMAKDGNEGNVQTQTPKTAPDT